MMTNKEEPYAYNNETSYMETAISSLFYHQSHRFTIEEPDKTMLYSDVINAVLLRIVSLPHRSAIWNFRATRCNSDLNRHPDIV